MTIKIERVPVPIIKDEIEIRFGLGHDRKSFPVYGTPTARRDKNGVWNWVGSTQAAGEDVNQIVLDEVLALREELDELQLRKGI